MTSTAIDPKAIKQAQRAGRESGDYARMRNTLQVRAELLVCALTSMLVRPCAMWPVVRETRGIAAARRFADVTGVDYAVALLEQGRRRAAHFAHLLLHRVRRFSRWST